MDKLILDRDDMISALHEIEKLIPEDGHQEFVFWANDIECAYDVIMERLRHAESERFRQNTKRN